MNINENNQLVCRIILFAQYCAYKNVLETQIIEAFSQ